MYFPSLYHYCHVAFEDSWTESFGISYPDLYARDRLGFPTVHVETDFWAPVRYGDVVDFTVWISRVGYSSVVFEFRGHVGSKQVLRSSHTKVCTDLDTMTKRQIPDALRARFEALSGGS